MFLKSHTLSYHNNRPKYLHLNSTTHVQIARTEEQQIYYCIQPKRWKLWVIKFRALWGAIERTNGDSGGAASGEGDISTSTNSSLCFASTNRSLSSPTSALKACAVHQIRQHLNPDCNETSESCSYYCCKFHTNAAKQHVPSVLYVLVDFPSCV